ncbi:MAG: DUF6171 family protein [Lachnospiraceae bacterium]|nr:DUF6171 family protein [Lachnospiraceae bacterium]
MTDGENQVFSGTDGEKYRFCKRCLIKDIGDKELIKTVADYIDRISPDIKADDELYKMRLECCKNCENLLHGVCKKCGCYVEMRAVVKNNYCPDVKKKW